MKVLVACEWSGVVRDAFLRRGHDAVSCDLLPTEAPGPHIQGDVLPLLCKPWDVVIAFPPCTHLASSGARWFPEKRHDGRQRAGIDFFMAFTEVSCSRVCIENPVGIMSTVWRKPDQIIQPYQFGHPESKRTCLWLKNLPPLMYTSVVEPVWHKTMNGTDYRDSAGSRYSPTHYNPEARWRNQTPSGQNNLGPSPDRAKIRGKTYAGIAEAMATQWTEGDSDGLE